MGAPSFDPYGLGRFYESPPWRVLILDLDSVVVTWLDKALISASTTYTRNAPTLAEGNVPSDHPKVNIVYDGDGHDEPCLAEGIRTIVELRREGPYGHSSLDDPWVVRNTGIILGVEDRVDAGGNPVTTYRAADPWKYLYKRSVIRNEDGDLPTYEGLRYTGQSADDILIEQLEWQEGWDGPMFLDFGQTGLNYGGTLETTPVIDEITFQRGSSVGEMFDALVKTGTVDLPIAPIYDPVNRPGLIGELSILERHGVNRTGSVFAWDRFPNTLSDLSRVQDGNERANVVQFYTGQGGPAVEPIFDGPSYSKYGAYILQQMWAWQTSPETVELLADRILDLQRAGRFTFSMTPVPENAPVPLQEYVAGDAVPVYASDSFRSKEATWLRVESIPIVRGADQLERVNGLLVSREPDLGPEGSA